MNQLRDVEHLEEETDVLPAIDEVSYRGYRGDDWPTEPNTLVRNGLAALAWDRQRQVGPGDPIFNDTNEKR